MGEEDLRPIVDLSRVRSDIVEEIMKLIPEGQMLQKKFLTEHPPIGFDFSDFMQRKSIGHRRYLRGEGTKGLISHDELLYYAKLNRYVSEGYAYVKEPIPDDVIVTSVDANGVSAEWQDCGDPDMDSVILYIHGGSFIAGSVKNHRIMTFPIGRLCKTRVLSIDYRLAPEHPFPSQLEDALSAYTYLLEIGVSPSRIILMGFSAGGAILLSLLSRLRERGIENPAGAVLKSPVTDLSTVHPSFRNNAPLDPSMGDGGRFVNIQAYIGDSDPSDSLISPLYADMSGFPSLLVQVGTNEVLYDECKELVENANSAGVEAIFQAFPEMVHSWHLLDIPEAQDAFERIGNYVSARLTT